MMRCHQLVGLCFPHCVQRGLGFVHPRGQRGLVLSLLLVALFVSTLAAGQSASGDTQKNTIRGVVVNSATREPI